MDAVIAVRNRILVLCDECEITINKLTATLALPPSSIKNVLYGKSQNPKLITIKMICDGLGITLGEFFSTPEHAHLHGLPLSCCFPDEEYNQTSLPSVPSVPAG